MLIFLGDIMSFVDDFKQHNAERQSKLYEKTLSNYNIFEGVECNVILPEKQLKTSGKSGATKGAATLAFGFVGLAATSGTSQNEENRNIRTIIQVVDKGIVFKNGSMDGSDIRIPYNQIIKMELFGEKSNNQGLLTLLRNKRVIIVPKLLDKKQSEIILTHLMNIINERASGIKYEDPGWGLETERIDSDSELVRLDNSQVSELERLANLFDKGFLTDDEFKNMKKKIIEN